MQTNKAYKYKRKISYSTALLTFHVCILMGTTNNQCVCGGQSDFENHCIPADLLIDSAMKMSRAAMRRPSTTVTPLGSSTLEDAASSSSSSTSICSCSTSPALEEPTHPVDLFLEPDLCPLTALVERFLMTISIFLATPLHFEAMAITPNDHRVHNSTLAAD